MSTALAEWASTDAMTLPSSEEIAQALAGILEPIIRDLVVEQVAQLLPATGVEREGMTAEEVAIFLGVERKTVYDYSNRGVIPHQRIGKRLVFSRKSLFSWLDSNVQRRATS